MGLSTKNPPNIKESENQKGRDANGKESLLDWLLLQPLDDGKKQEGLDESCRSKNRHPEKKGKGVLHRGSLFIPCAPALARANGDA